MFTTQTPKTALSAIFADNAYFGISSAYDGYSFTFKVKQVENKLYYSVLVGPNKYEYVGVSYIWDADYSVLPLSGKISPSITALGLAISRLKYYAETGVGIAWHLQVLLYSETCDTNVETED